MLKLFWPYFPTDTVKLYSKTLEFDQISELFCISKKLWWKTTGARSSTNKFSSFRGFLVLTDLEVDYT